MTDPASVDLNALLASSSFQPQAQVTYANPIALKKKETKKALTADQKRAKLCANVLTSKDPFGLDYCALLSQMDRDELDQLVLIVKAQLGMA